MTRFNHFTTWLLASLPLFLLLLFQIPITLYHNNIYELPFSLSAIWMLMLCIALMASAGTSAVLAALFKGKPATVLQNSLLILACLVWIEANLLTAQYGVLDGTPVQWNAFFYSAMLDSTIWFAGIYIGFRLHAHFLRSLAYFLLFFSLLTSAVSLAGSLADQPTSLTNLANDPRTEYQFSHDRNVIIVVWDSFQSNIVQEVLRGSPELAASFAGFRFHKNTVGGYPATLPSIPLILTGKFFNNDRPFSEYLQDAYDHQSLPGALKQRGFLSHLYPWYPHTSIASPAVQDNLVPKTRSLPEQLSDIARLHELAFFSGLPHYLKSFVYHNGEWQYVPFLHSTGLFSHLRSLSNPIPEGAGSGVDPGPEEGDRDTEALRRMIKSIHVSQSKPTFKFFHLFGAHVPFELDENGKRIRVWTRKAPFALELNSDTPRPMGEYAERYIRKMTYKLKLMGKFVDVLKEKGIYKQSLVIFIGDHGLGVDPYLIDLHHPQSMIPQRTNMEVKAKATAMVMIKDFDSDTGFEITDEPISLPHLRNYVLSAVDGQRSSEHPTRIRRFVDYEWERKFDDTLQGYREYAVAGHSWLDSSWIPLHLHPYGENQDDCPFVRYKRLEFLGHVSSRNRKAQRIQFSFTTRGSELVIVMEAGSHDDITASVDGKTLEPVGMIKGGKRYKDFVERDIVFYGLPKHMTQGTLRVSSNKKLERVSILQGMR